MLKAKAADIRAANIIRRPLIFSKSRRSRSSDNFRKCAYCGAPNFEQKMKCHNCGRFFDPRQRDIELAVVAK